MLGGVNMRKVQIYINKQKNKLKYRKNGGGGVVPNSWGSLPPLGGCKNITV